MNNPSVGIIGLGNVGGSLGLGLAQTAYKERVIACDRNQPKRDRLRERTGIETTSDWREVLEAAEITLLCLRTEQVHDFLDEAIPFLKAPNVLTCLSAGVRLDALERRVADAGCDVVRAITNVNVAAREGHSIILQSRPPTSTDGLEGQVVQLFESLGHVKLTDSEEMLDTQSVLTGCAPAVTALFLEALANLGEDVGFEKEEAERIAGDNVQATIKTMRDLHLSPKAYKHSVAAPGGIVERILQQRESEQLEEAVADWFRSILTTLQEE
jgi:pyrroline-5-carboxylate reductase